MKIKLYNAKILISPLDKIISGEIHTDGLYITGVYEKDAPKLSFDREIDCGDNLLMSGFCNAHTHSSMSLFRGLADDLALETWLYEKIFPLESKLLPEDIYWASCLQMAEYAKSGITAICDMYAYPEITAKAAEKANIAAVFCGGLNDTQLSAKEVLDINFENYNTLNNKSPRQKYMLGLHAEYTCSSALLEGLADLSQTLNAPTYIHLSETLKEVGDCSVRYNLTPPEYLHKIGYFDNGGMAAHCTYVTNEDIKLLKEKNITAVINSASNLKLASGIAPVYSMLNNKLDIAIGTDGVASNNCASMFKEMYLFSCLQKTQMKDAAVVKAQQALYAATIGGYEAQNLKGGKLEKDYFADIILIDLNQPNMQPKNNLVNHLVYSADNSNIILTMAGGKIIYENAKIDIGENIDDIYKQCQKIINRLTN